jgi:hypothetical protein
MNTADIPCLKITEQNPGENDINWYNRVYLCYENTNFKPPTTYGGY